MCLVAGCALSAAGEPGNSREFSIPSSPFRYDGHIPGFKVSKVATCSEWIGTGADIGHWPAAGIKLSEGVQKPMASRNFALHFVDVGRVWREAHSVPYGTGVPQLREVLNALKAKGVKFELICEYGYQSQRLE